MKINIRPRSEDSGLKTYVQQKNREDFKIWRRFGYKGALDEANYAYDMRPTGPLKSDRTTPSLSAPAFLNTKLS